MSCFSAWAGSSLAPEVFQKTFGNAPGYPELVMLDSTHPGAVKSVEAKIDLAQSLFLVSSKSGTTTETNSFFFYFWDKLKRIKDDPGQHFVAITDPGTPLEKLAAERKFPRDFPCAGGRRRPLFRAYRLWSGAGCANRRRCWRSARARPSHERQLRRCRGGESKSRPGAGRGAGRAGAGEARQSNVSCARRRWRRFPIWVEQLIAESTGKESKGIVPVANEGVGAPEKYGDDRFFVYLRLKGDENHRPRPPGGGAASQRPPGGAHRFERQDTISARSSSAGNSPWRRRARRSASTRSINPMFNWRRIWQRKRWSENARRQEERAPVSKMKSTVSDRRPLRQAVVGMARQQEESARLCRRPGLSRSVAGKHRKTARDLRDHPRPAWGGHDARFRPALSPFHRTTAQGRAEFGFGITDCRSACR